MPRGAGDVDHSRAAYPLVQPPPPLVWMTGCAASSGRSSKNLRASVIDSSLIPMATISVKLVAPVRASLGATARP